MNTATAIISGCRVGLKDSKNGGLLVGKEWRVIDQPEFRFEVAFDASWGGVRGLSFAM